jgi:hypothetical protein
MATTCRDLSPLCGFWDPETPYHDLTMLPIYPMPGSEGIIKDAVMGVKGYFVHVENRS